MVLQRANKGRIADAENLCCAGFGQRQNTGMEKRTLLFTAGLLAAAGPLLAQPVITCSSDDMQRHYCDAGGGQARLVRQRSDAECRQGYTWGQDSRGIWVDRGCRADFEILQTGSYSGADSVLTCSSDDMRRHYCDTGGRRVTLVRQRSDATCREGYSWGQDSQGVWVDRGCRADFQVQQTSAGYYGDSGSVLTCSSDDMRRHYCDTGGRRVTLARQRSDAACREGYTWGQDNQGVWVDRGCRADFQIQQARVGYGDTGSVLTCSSDDMRRHYCDTGGRRVTLARQRSDAACREGYTWGQDNRGVWVDQGCRADFQIQQARVGYGDTGSVVTCSSDDMKRHYCDTGGQRVTLVRQRSDAACREGYSWGQDSRGVWVDHGCRADFQVGGRHGGRYWPH